jgi:site-specific recombinase XerC
VAVEAQAEGLPLPTMRGMASHLESHLEWCRQRNLRPRTIQARRDAILRFRRVEELDPLEATREQMSDWYAHVPGVAETRSAELSHIRGFVRWAVAHNIVTGDTTAQLPRPKLPRRLPRPIAEDRLANAISTATPQVKAMLVLAGYAGLRAFEIAALYWRDIDDDRGLLLVADGKGGQQRTMPLHPMITDAIGALPGIRRGPVIHRLDGKPGPLTHWRVSQLANRHLHDLGYPDTLHSLRHRYATVVYQLSNDLRLTQELLGHASPNTTAGYTAWDVKKAGEVVRRLP